MIFAMLSITACGDRNLSSPENVDSVLKQQMQKYCSNLIVQRDRKNQSLVLLAGKDLIAEMGGAELQLFVPETSDLAELALAFIETHHDLFLLDNPGEELTVGSIQDDELGFTHITFTQRYENLPVWKSSIKLHFNREYKLYRVTGSYLPTPRDLITIPSRTVSELGIRTAGVRERQLLICQSSAGAAMLCYHLRYENRDVFIDAASGDVLLELPRRQTNSWSY